MLSLISILLLIFDFFCFAAAMAFINTGKNRGFFQRSECSYGALLGDFFGSSCAPGARDLAHDPNVTNPESLCSLCRSEIINSPPILVQIPSVLRGIL